MIIVFSTVDTAEQEVCLAECIEVTADDYANGAVVMTRLCRDLNPIFATKKDSIVDRVSAMEFCFIYGKCLYLALKPLISVILRAFFLIKPINPPLLAPTRQKRRILYV